MNKPRPTRPLFVLPNYLYGFRQFCDLHLNTMERHLFATLEHNRSKGRQVRLYFNHHTDQQSDQLLSRLAEYVRWISHLNRRTLSIAIVSHSRAHAQQFASTLVGSIRIYTSRSVVSAVGRTFDMVFILNAHRFKRCKTAKTSFSTAYDRALHVFGVFPYFFVLGRFNPRARAANTFHHFYRKARTLQEQSPDYYCAFSPCDLSSAPSGHALNYRPPAIRHDLMDPDDPEILIGFTTSGELVAQGISASLGPPSQAVLKFA